MNYAMALGIKTCRRTKRDRGGERNKNNNVKISYQIGLLYVKETPSNRRVWQPKATEQDSKCTVDVSSVTSVSVFALDLPFLNFSGVLAFFARN